MNTDRYEDKEDVWIVTGALLWVAFTIFCVISGFITGEWWMAIAVGSSWAVLAVLAACYGLAWWLVGRFL